MVDVAPDRVKSPVAMTTSPDSTRMPPFSTWRGPPTSKLPSVATPVTPKVPSVAAVDVDLLIKLSMAYV